MRGDGAYSLEFNAFPSLLFLTIDFGGLLDEATASVSLLLSATVICRQKTIDDNYCMKTFLSLTINQWCLFSVSCSCSRVDDISCTWKMTYTTSQALSLVRHRVDIHVPQQCTRRQRQASSRITDVNPSNLSSFSRPRIVFPQMATFGDRQWKW